jgi:uncharacterized membrane protein
VILGLVLFAIGASLFIPAVGMAKNRESLVSQTLGFTIMAMGVALIGFGAYVAWWYMYKANNCLAIKRIQPHRLPNATAHISDAAPAISSRAASFVNPRNGA